MCTLVTYTLQFQYLYPCFSGDLQFIHDFFDRIYSRFSVSIVFSTSPINLVILSGVIYHHHFYGPNIVIIREPMVGSYSKSRFLFCNEPNIIKFTNYKLACSSHDPLTQFVSPVGNHNFWILETCCTCVPLDEKSGELSCSH